MTSKAPDGPVTLAPLLELRRALCSGRGEVAAAFRVVDRAAGRGSIADLWKVQSDLLQNDAAAARTSLERFAPPIDRPLAELLRGKITAPFAGVGELNPQLVAILAHELAHAMIAHATSDQAPHWFQEGYAQRVQGSRISANAFNMYEDDKYLPLVLLDPVLTGSPDPEMIGAAYIVAQTDIRYIEAKYGKGGLQKIMAAFRDGATTEEAIRAVSGKPLTEFDQDLRQWGRSEQRVFEN